MHKYKLLFVCLVGGLLSGCSSQKEETQIATFSSETVTQMKTVAMVYPDSAYQVSSND